MKPIFILSFIFLIGLASCLNERRSIKNLQPLSEIQDQKTGFQALTLLENMLAKYKK